MDARASLMSMSGREYLDFLQLRVYFTDVVHQLLASRDEHPVEFMHQYFRRVGAMEHVVGREYAFVSATCWNRRAFVLSCHATFGALALVELTVADFHQLLMLLCPDFPKAPVDAVVHLLPRAVRRREDPLLGARDRVLRPLALRRLLPRARRRVPPERRRRNAVAAAAAAAAPRRRPTGGGGGGGAGGGGGGSRRGAASRASRRRWACPSSPSACASGRAKGGGAARRAASPLTSVIEWPTVEARCGGGLRDRGDARKLCQCLLQSDELGRQLRRRPAPPRAATRRPSPRCSRSSRRTRPPPRSRRSPRRGGAGGGAAGDGAAAATTTRTTTPSASRASPSKAKAVALAAAAVASAPTASSTPATSAGSAPSRPRPTCRAERERAFK